MYDELVARLRSVKDSWQAEEESWMLQAADAIEELSAKVDSLQLFADSISRLPDCNTCLKKGLCEFMPRYGEYCRINCPHWLGEPPEEG